MNFLKRTWAEIDLDAILHNYREIRAAASPAAKICCVVKADAYGHGAPMVAHELDAAGADWFAVSNLEEAIQLRQHAIQKPILIMGFTPPQFAQKLAELGLSQTVISLDYAKELSSQAKQAAVTVNVHLKIDTGMTRVGFLYQDPIRDADSIEEMTAACRMEGLFSEGVFTHFAVSDEGAGGAAFTQAQFAYFLKALRELAHRGIQFSLRHCANSGAICDYPESHLDMVRPGIILYGLHPSGVIQRKLNLMPAMELKTAVSMVKQVHSGLSVSYGRCYTTQQFTKIATVPIGYADGYPRIFSGKAEMLVKGKRVPILGRVCMDQLMLDVTAVPGVREGDVVTVFGQDGTAVLPVDELAALNDTISYEMVCLVGKRVPRIYLKNGEVAGSLNYICPEY